MYMLLEALTFPHVALDLPPEVGMWATAEGVREAVVDGQRFWFLGLVFAVVVGVLRVFVQGKRGKGLRLVADVLDLAVPGSVVGWVPLGQGTVAWCMLGSTVLTGWEVWERCGREVREGRRR